MELSVSRKGENNANSYKWANNAVLTFKDEIAFKGNRFYSITATSPRLMEGANMRPAAKTSGTYIDTDFEGWPLQSSSASPFLKHLHAEQAPELNDWQRAYSM